MLSGIALSYSCSTGSILCSPSKLDKAGDTCNAQIVCWCVTANYRPFGLVNNVDSKRLLEWSCDSFLFIYQVHDLLFFFPVYSGMKLRATESTSLLWKYRRSCKDRNSFPFNSSSCLYAALWPNSHILNSVFCSVFTELSPFLRSGCISVCPRKILNYS